MATINKINGRLQLSINATSNDLIWQIWLLKSSGGYSSLNLFYSWIAPITSNNKGWQPLAYEYETTIQNNIGKTIKLELLRVSYYGKHTEIQNIINGMLSGKLLSEAIAPPESSLLPNEVLNLKMGNDAASIAKTYQIRPRVFLPVEHILVPWSSRSISSPVDYGCLVDQIVLLQKENLISFEDYVLEKNNIKKLIEGISTALQKSTGFNIRKESAPRIGNIEWYQLPFSDKDFEPYVSFWIQRDKSGYGKSVHLDIKPIPIETTPKSLFLRCRIINGEEVSLDQVKEILWNDKNLNMQFDSEEPISEVCITIWEKDKESGAFSILFEKPQICIRTINFDMSVVGSKINTGKMNLLNKLRQNEKKVSEDLAVFDRSTKVSTSKIGGLYVEDPWVASGRAIISFMKTLFPEKSEGHFFLNGWDDYKEESGQLSFVQWMLDTISGDSESGLIFIDPFFDKDGIELFCHTRTTNTKYRILTCTQHRENDNPGDKTATKQPSANKETKTVASIRAVCEAMQPILNAIELYIQDIRSNEGGRGQVFHDRYLLITDKNGDLEKGFHLSNSIQGATRKAPLLITPIPADILPDVLEYVENLLAPDEKNSSSRKTHLVQIYPDPATDPHKKLKKKIQMK